MSTNPSHRKSILEARYDKDWSSLRLSFTDLKQFIEAIKIGDLDTLELLLGAKSSFDDTQKRALLTKCFNEYDFNHAKGGVSIKNAESLAEKYENPAVINYIREQKKQFPSPLGQKGIGFHSNKHTEPDSSKVVRPKVHSSK